MYNYRNHQRARILNSLSMFLNSKKDAKPWPHGTVCFIANSRLCLKYGYWLHSLISSFTLPLPIFPVVSSREKSWKKSQFVAYTVHLNFFFHIRKIHTDPCVRIRIFIWSEVKSKLIFIIYWYIPWIKNKRIGPPKIDTYDVFSFLEYI